MLMAWTNVHETDHYEVVDEGKKSTPLGAGVYKEVDKRTQRDTTSTIRKCSS